MSDARAEGGERGAQTEPRRSDFRQRLLIGAPIFLALFIMEYPPLFLLGYWSWGGVVHKVLSGVFLILNLVVAQYASRRLSRGSDAPAMGTGKSQDSRGESEAGRPTARKDTQQQTLT